uniref:C2H2-type domain-containing protein n=1 Tax=Glossina palpalis gambiensis TaxID=67801 RepID=A0A1B0AXX9_9MUSC
MDNKDLCGVIFIDDKQLLSFQCSICKRTFETPNLLLDHLSEHYTEIKMKKKYQLDDEYDDGKFYSVTNDDNDISVEVDPLVDKLPLGLNENLEDFIKIEIADDYANDIPYSKNNGSENRLTEVGEELLEKSFSTFITDSEDTIILKELSVTVQTHEISSRSENVSDDQPSQPKFRCSRPRKNFDQPRLHKCELCGFAFKDKRLLQGHVIRHSGKKDYTCPKCSKKFYTRMELKLHDRRHTGERSYLCMLCGRSFVTSTEYQGHIRRHENNRPYKCNQCNKSFFDGYQMRKHQITHTNERTVPCPQCPSLFKCKKTLRAHLKIHLNKREHICKFCDAAFNQKPGLISHMKSKHKTIQNKY